MVRRDVRERRGKVGAIRSFDKAEVRAKLILIHEQYGCSPYQLSRP